MIKLFSSEKQNVSEENSSALAVKFYKTHCERVESLKKHLTIPGENEACFLWTLKSFNAFTFIPFCIEKFGCIDELYLSTYTISRKITDTLVQLVDTGKIKYVHIFVSESLKFRMPDVMNQLNTILPNRANIKLQFAWNHSKITCAKCGENYLVLEGSGNWSDNAQYEQYLLTNSKTVYEFRKSNICPVE
jgi:hypothetical protein